MLGLLGMIFFGFLHLDLVDLCIIPIYETVTMVGIVLLITTASTSSVQRILDILGEKTLSRLGELGFVYSNA